MKKEIAKIKYFLYARKSSESEDRQIASVESQINELTKIAERNGFTIIEILSESQSAKAPGRPIFNKMIERIYGGEAQGVICWKLDRLARNPIDGGNISWMLQKGIIQHIQTNEKDYYPTDNVLMMSVEFGMANQFIRDLSQNTKRGMISKLEKGWQTGIAPLGYLNDKENKIITKDPERFNLIRKMWDLMLTGNYTPPKILDIANSEWGLKTRKFKRIGGNPLSRSSIYKIFTNLFYARIVKNAGVQYRGAHDQMITLEEYDRVQMILGRKGKPRPKTHIFAFTGLMRCGECGAMITAEEKVKRQKNGNIHRYIYYHCTKRKNPNCTQKCIEEKELEKQIKAAIDTITIPPELHDFALKWLKKENKKESQTTTAVLDSQEKGYKDCLKKLAGLIDMRAGGEINEEEFQSRKIPLTAEKKHWEGIFTKTSQATDQWLNKADEVFSFARDAKLKFEKGDPMEKKEVFSRLGSNLLLRDRIITIDIENTLIPIKALAKEERRLEPLKIGKNEIEIEQIYTQSPRLLPR